jgi:hypothetical protein
LTRPLLTFVKICGSLAVVGRRVNGDAPATSHQEALGYREAAGPELRYRAQRTAFCTWEVLHG